jgi:hypothetical protein
MKKNLFNIDLNKSSDVYGLQSLSQIGFGVDINFPCKQGKFLKYNYWSIINYGN